MGFKSLLSFVFGALVVAACTAHNGFAGLPIAGSVGPALLTRAEPTSIPLIANAGRKSGFHVQLSIAGTPAKSFLFDTGSGVREYDRHAQKARSRSPHRSAK
jgi:hypothetical protein